jgi:Asp/Glu/hydantoin racemase
MAGPRIVLVHALRESVEPANAAMARGWPAAAVGNLLDDSLSRDHAAAGGVLDEAMVGRFLALGRYAASTGAAGILFTCSAFGAAIERVRAALAIPVVKPNEAAIDAALDAGPRIALLATFPMTLASMAGEVEERARTRNLVPTIVTRAVDGALDALRAGDAAGHDRLIAAAVAALDGVDAVVLAQFSMARAAAAVAPRARPRLVTTPDSAVERLRSLVEAGRR